MPEGLQCGPLKIIQVNDNDNEPNTRGLNKAYSYPHHQPQLRREWRQPKNRNKRRNLIGPNTSIAKSNNYFVKANHNSNKVKQEQQRENNNIENFHASKIFDAISTTATQNSITSTVRARNPLRIYIRHSPDKLNTNHITSPFNNITGCNGTHNRKHTNLSRYASIHSKALTTSPPSPYLSKEETIRRTKATLLSNPILFLMLSNALLAAKVFMNSAATVATSTALLRPIVTLSAAVAASFAAAASNSAIGISPSLATLDLESAILEGGNSSSTNLSHISYGLNSSSSSEGVVGRGMSINGSAIVAFGDISFNDSDELTEDASEYVFDRTDVRIIFIALYTIVFCCCFFGNLLVILVVTLSRRLRSITNFFLANLALADFCVGLFCVMQNLSIYLIDSWVFGEFLCRMYQFVHSLSYTASIFILVVICMERYFAIVHPITCKQILTAARLRMVILTVWITSAVYSTPKFVFSKTIKNIHNEDGHQEEICVLDRKMFNSKLLDMINFVLLYVIPLLVMTVLYSKIAIALWRSSRGLSHHIAQQQQHDNNVSGMTLHNSMYHHHGNNQHPQAPAVHIHASPHQQQSRGQDPPNTPLSASSGGLYRKQSSKYEKRGVSITESQTDCFKVSLDSNRPIVSACRKTSFYAPTHHTRHGTQRSHHNVAHMSHSSNNVLRARRGVVRMLIIFVLTFALCNLPYHARKMWQYWSRSYRGDSNFNALLTPLTFLVTYFNSGINPLLYAFLSRNFRKGMKELLLCSWKKGKGKSSSNSSMHHKRTALQTHSLPTDTTHIGNEQL